VREAVLTTLPTWRRLTPLEHALPQFMEFTVWETTSPALFTTLGLSGGMWSLSPELRDSEAPLSSEALKQHLWMMP
jgi:hypothetical protein